MDINPSTREKIITLAKYTSKTQRDIAKECKVSLASVCRILKRQSNTGCVDVQRKGKCGRKGKITPRASMFLLRESKINPKKSSFDLKKDMQMHGINIHDSTIRYHLLKAGRKAIRPAKKQLLTHVMKKKRLAWAKKYKHWTVEDWKKVLFSDETYFMVQGQHSRYVRKHRDENLTSAHISQTVKYPVKTMFWGCFSYNGTGSLVPVEGNMTSLTYKDLLQRKLQQNLKKTCPKGAIFQQDSAPCHKSKIMEKFFKENGIKCLEWPGNSPDLNPIENLWAICKNRVRKMDCTTKTKMIEAVIKVWFNDDKINDNCKNLVKSMPKRINEVLKNKGGHIKY
jgi:transposase